jgi:hypothetical protein
MYKEFPKLKLQIIKTQRRMNREFSEEQIQMVNKYMKKCSTSLAVKEMLIKTTLRFHLLPVTMAIFKNKNNNEC